MAVPATYRLVVIHLNVKILETLGCIAFLLPVVHHVQGKGLDWLHHRMVQDAGYDRSISHLSSVVEVTSSISQ